MTRLVLPVLTVVALLSHPTANARGVIAQSGADDPAAPRVAALIRAFDRGDMPAFRDFVAHNYALTGRASQDPEGTATYWAAVRRELGPIRLIRPETAPIPGREEIVWWVRGTISKAVVAIRIDVEPDEPHRIVGGGVMRGPDPTQGRDATPTPGDYRAYLHEYLSAAAEANLFSGVVVVAHGDDIVFEGAYGWADRESQTRATLTTPFKLASASKMFTGVAIAQLAEQGRLSYDDTIDRFIPEYPAHIASQVTIHHLLTHTSGIELDRDPEYQSLVRGATSLEDLLNAQVRFIDRLNSGNYENFAPLNRFDYTNEGLDLLGVIVARASGVGWRQYVRRNVLEPAGMLVAGTDLLDPVPGLAKGYTLLNEDLNGFLPGDRRPVGDDEIDARVVFRPAGSGYATALDMVRFMAALGNGRLLSSNSFDLATRMHVTQMSIPGAGARGYGYAFMVSDAQGLRTVGHDGGATGMSTVVEFHPELGTTLVVLSNYDRIAGHYAAHIRELLANSANDD